MCAINLFVNFINEILADNKKYFWLLIWLCKKISGYQSSFLGYEKGGGVGNTAFVVIPVAEGIGAHERDFKSREIGRSQTSTVGDWFDTQACASLRNKNWNLVQR